MGGGPRSSIVTARQPHAVGTERPLAEWRSQRRLVLLPGKSTAITADPNGNFWITVPPLPSVFSGQAIYVNSNGTIVPGVYDVDASAGTVTLTDDSGRSRPHSDLMSPGIPG
jgi:hypothetical protein